MAKRPNGNKWILDNLLKIAAISAAAVAAWAILSEDVKEMQPQIKAMAEDIITVEKDIIGVKGSIESLKVQQQMYHKDSDEKLDEILDRLPLK